MKLYKIDISKTDEIISETAFVDLALEYLIIKYVLNNHIKLEPLEKTILEEYNKKIKDIFQDYMTTCYSEIPAKKYMNNTWINIKWHDGVEIIASTLGGLRISYPLWEKRSWYKKHAAWYNDHVK